MGKGKIINNDVPCNGCVECCKGDLIFLHPELGDKASRYETQVIEGRYALKHNDSGDCIYLDRDKGCSIHSNRPAICRELDCALFLAMDPNKLIQYIRDGAITFNVLKAAKRRLAREVDPESVLAKFRKRATR